MATPVFLAFSKPIAGELMLHAIPPASRDCLDQLGVFGQHVKLVGITPAQDRYMVEAAPRDPLVVPSIKATVISVADHDGLAAELERLARELGDRAHDALDQAKAMAERAVALRRQPVPNGNR